MAGNHKRRKRSVDLKSLTIDQADRLGKQMGDEIAKIMDEANNKCNNMLNIYGLQTQIGYEIVQVPEKTDKKSVKRPVNSQLKKIAKL